MNKAYFIHIPKNGGQTIRRNTNLRNVISTSRISTDLCPPEYVKQMLATMKKYGEHHGKAHARWRDWDPSVRESKPVFANVRNPWSRTYSRWTFLNQGLNKIAINKRCTFEEFLEQRYEYGNIPFFWHSSVRGWYPQKDYVTDEDGNLRVDIMRTEHLSEDLSKYLKWDPKLERKNVSNLKKIDYRDVYTQETKNIVKDWYQEDIEFFGFTFDGPATKNIWNNK